MIAACWLDFDGCFNEEVTAMGQEFYFQPRPGSITEHVLDQTAKASVNEFQFSSFSNRQDLHTDWQNSCKRDHLLGYVTPRDAHVMPRLGCTNASHAGTSRTVVLPEVVQARLRRHCA